MSEHQFDWNSANEVVPEQARTAVYTNSAGSIVIRQGGLSGHPDEDGVVVIHPRFIRDLIGSLESIADNLGV